MKKYLNIFLVLIICLIISGCENSIVTFMCNCKGNANYNCVTSNGKIKCTIKDPQCEGKEFLGWYDAKENGKKVDLNGKFPKNITLYAYYKDDESIKPETPVENEPKEENEEPEKPTEEVEKSYTLSFNFNGGTGNKIENKTVKYNDSLPVLSKGVPTKEGYIFMGWYDNSDYTKGNEYYDNENKSLRKYDMANDIVLYAGWKKEEKQESNVRPEPSNVYVLSFDLNGGDTGQESDKKITYGSSMPTLGKDIPTRKGYMFMGWYDNSDYTKGYQYYNSKNQTTKKYNKTRSLTLYAGWAQSIYTITYNLNGGSNGQIGKRNIKYKEHLPSISKTIPTKTGYSFMGWYDNSDYTKGTQYYNEKNEPVILFERTSSVVLYAGWKKMAFIIYFDPNGGTGGQTSNLNATYKGSLPVIDKTIPTKAGYSFMGWYDNADYTKGKKYYNEKNEAVVIYEKNGNTKLYAGWKIRTYTITYELNGGDKGQTGQLSVAYSRSLPLISKTIPNKTGYTFMGWYDNKDYTKGTKYYNDKNEAVKKYDVANNVTLYAGWKANTITIKYDCNGGTGSTATQTVTYGQKVTLNANGCKKTNLTFKEWTDPSKKAWKDKWSGAWTYTDGQNGITNGVLTLKANYVYQVTVATYNIGYFGCGTSKKVKCKSTVSQITNMFKTYKIDIAGIQEAKPYKDVIKVGKNVGMNYYYKTTPYNINMILSKFKLSDKKTTTLASCGEKRSLDKTVVTINGVKISVYNTHYSYQKGCPAKQMENAAKIIKNDPNPVILTGDTNVSSKSYYEKYLKPIGFEIAAYDGKAHGYCDSVFIIPKGHIDVLSSQTVDVYGKYSDHNFVVATLGIH